MRQAKRIVVVVGDVAAIGAGDSAGLAGGVGVGVVVGRVPVGEGLDD